MKKNRWILLFSAAAILAAIISLYRYSEGASASAAINIFLSVLIVSLPLPLFLAHRLPLIRGMSRARRTSINLSGSKALSLLAQADTILLPRCGVVSKGKPYLTGLIPEGTDSHSLLALAASIEQSSLHPLGQAICSAAKARGVQQKIPAAINEVPSCGVEALSSRTLMRAGKSSWLQQEGVIIPAELLTKADQFSQRGQLPVFVADGKACRGMLLFDDDLSPENITALRRLHDMGLRLIMITGCSRRTASAVQKKAGLDEFRADLTNEARLREFQILQAHGATVIVAECRLQRLEAAGLQADLLLKLGDEELPSPGPSHPALLAGRSLHDLPQLIRISRRTMKRVRQNRFFVVIGWMLLLLPAASAILSPAAAFAGQSLLCLLILIHSLRICLCVIKKQ
ncbi:HAD family hydrolase [Selenomonas montiformis]